jgi:outer membrane protein assembly factor BamB
MDDFRAPDEPRAQERTWHVVAAAFAERDPARAPRRRTPLFGAVAVAAVAAVAVTPPGKAVITSVRKAIGVGHAQRALYRLPSPGRILAGGWIVNADGSTRRLGAYTETSWSPFGRYVVGARADELVALEPDGAVHWTLARPRVRFPRWAGTHTDTRIAYLTRDRLHVVAGDGTGDREVGPAAAAPVAPAWGAGFTLAYADTHGRVWAFDPETGRVDFRTPAGPRPRRLAWSRDGTRLLVVRPHALDVYNAGGRRVAHDGGAFVDAAFVGRRVAALSPNAVRLGNRVLFRTTGRLVRVVPSPDGRWLLVTWPGADEWLFVPTGRGRRLSAVANISKQLGGAAPLGGWTS